MTNVILHNHHYINLDSVTWCATAEIVAAQIVTQHQESQHQGSFKREQQRNGVRVLLKELLAKLAISDTLDESAFPYRLVNSGYYVCFSHSGDSYSGESHSQHQVAVVLSRRRAVGIDIETRNIAWHVAERFYHANEIDILSTLPVDQRTAITKQLWQVKESIIKIKQYKLTQGLGVDYAPIIPALIDGLSQHSIPFFVLNEQVQDYQIAMLSAQQTIIVF